jgi:hypothetical protein
LGEYIGLTAWSGWPTPIWTDIRNLHQDAYAGYWLGGADIALPEAAPAVVLRSPNPVRAGEGVALDLDFGAAQSDVRDRQLWILDATGRLVRALDLPAGDRARGRMGLTLRWDGCATSGVSAPPGVYFVRLPAAAAAAKLVVVE